MAALVAESFEIDASQTYSEAIFVGNGWETAISNELEALEKNETWKIVKRPEKEKVIDSR